MQKLELRVEREHVNNRCVHTTFRIEIDLGDGLSQRERVLLFNSARKCDVHELLDGNFQFDYRLVNHDEL